MAAQAAIPQTLATAPLSQYGGSAHLWGMAGQAHHDVSGLGFATNSHSMCLPCTKMQQKFLRQKANKPPLVIGGLFALCFGWCLLRCVRSFLVIMLNIFNNEYDKKEKHKEHWQTKHPNIPNCIK